MRCPIRSCTPWSFWTTAGPDNPFAVLRTGRLNLQAGWALAVVSIPPAGRAALAEALGIEFTAVRANSTLTSVEDKWSTLIGYNSENQTYESSIINNDNTGGSHDENGLMYPWKGYWLYMTSAGELAAIS